MKCWRMVYPSTSCSDWQPGPHWWVSPLYWLVDKDKERRRNENCIAAAAMVWGGYTTVGCHLWSCEGGWSMRQTHFFFALVMWDQASWMVVSPGLLWTLPFPPGGNVALQQESCVSVLPVRLFNSEPAAPSGSEQGTHYEMLRVRFDPYCAKRSQHWCIIRWTQPAPTPTALAVRVPIYSKVVCRLCTQQSVRTTFGPTRVPLGCQCTFSPHGAVVGVVDDPHAGTLVPEDVRLRTVLKAILGSGSHGLSP